MNFLEGEYLKSLGLFYNENVGVSRLVLIKNDGSETTLGDSSYSDIDVFSVFNFDPEKYEFVGFHGVSATGL